FVHGGAAWRQPSPEGSLQDPVNGQRRERAACNTCVACKHRRENTEGRCQGVPKAGGCQRCHMVRSTKTCGSGSNSPLDVQYRTQAHRRLWKKNDTASGKRIRWISKSFAVTPRFLA
ncbi:unnamed protein product, partial [Ectocarpus sp. 4 AP-2014]